MYVCNLNLYKLQMFLGFFLVCGDDYTIKKKLYESVEGALRVLVTSTDLCSEQLRLRAARVFSPAPEHEQHQSDDGCKKTMSTIFHVDCTVHSIILMYSMHRDM